MSNNEDTLKRILKIFEEISRIPRCSKNEKAIGDWAINWAKDNHFSFNQDEAGNIVIHIPASSGYENRSPIVFQGHLDMVCEKNDSSTHDFAHDPIDLVYDGDWISANGTTLGADNGIGVAISMAMALDPQLKHPKMQLLLTVDEETGLNGAAALDSNFINGKYLLNLDTETEGLFTIGCAGGCDTILEITINYEDASEELIYLKIRADKMKGGHSGIDIDKNRANAIKILSNILYQLLDQVKFKLIQMEGGTAHNAIPREAWAVVAIEKEDAAIVEKIVLDKAKEKRKDFSQSDPELQINIEKLSNPSNQKLMDEESTLKLIRLLNSIPHGVIRMDREIEGLVETSTNLAKLRIQNTKAIITTSQRSSTKKGLSSIINRIEEIGSSFNGMQYKQSEYPPWQPDWKSQLLEKSKSVYQTLYGTDPGIRVVHAGLECGIIGNKYPEMQMISFGPTILNAHSPNECLNIPSILKVYHFVAKLVEELD